MTIQLTLPYFLLAKDVPLVEVAVEEVEVADALPSATLTPNVVPVITLVTPALVAVVVKVTVAVVVAEQADQEVHGALEFQSPEVQPVQVLPGQAPPPHQLVHAPDVQDPEEPHGPQPPEPSPNGPKPGPQGPFLPDHPLVVHDGLAVTENVASGAAVTECPSLAQSRAIF